MEVRDPQPGDGRAAFVWIAVLLGFIALAVYADVHSGAGILSLLLILPGVWLLMRWMARAFAYRCPECGEVFQLGMLGQFTAVNMGDRRSVRCPRCGKRSVVKTLKRVD